MAITAEVYASLTPEQKSELAKMLAADKAANSTLTFKTSTKSGAMICYGMGRFPVTLHKTQWDRLVKAVQDGELAKALEAHAAGTLPKHTPAEREQ